MKFDYIIQNPPYNKIMHIDFFKKGIELLNDTGKMSIIEPATWLINIRKDGNAKRIYNPLKEMIKNKIEKITIDNLNSMFATKIFGLFSILKFDNSKNESSFILDICGNKSYVNDIYAVNLAGANVDKIMKKVISFKEHINKHFNAVKNDYSYVKANEFVLGFNDGYNTKTNIISINGIDYYSLCVCGSIHHSDQKIYDDVPLNKRNKLCDVIGGTREELENYLLLCKSKLNIFLNVLLYTDQRNHVMKYVPWLVDKQYTDQEIYEMFGFTEQEINLIEYTVEKFQYSSPFFKRYMCGPKSVSDQEVKDYIENLKKKHKIKSF